MDSLLKEFKERMHIFHSLEDDNLERILKVSLKDIESKGGSMASAKDKTTELTLERARYAYNDSLEFFNDNFREELLNLSLEQYNDGSGYRG